MQHTLEQIYQNPQNYKLCKSVWCDAINWHTNIVCVECGSGEHFGENLIQSEAESHCMDIADSTLVTHADGWVECRWEYITVKV
jgi:hypothetical protein